MLADQKRLKLSLLHVCALLPALNVWLESLLKFYKKKIQLLNSPLLSVYVWYHEKGFPGGSVGKNPPPVKETQVRSLGQEDSPRGGNGNPLQYSSLENPYGQRTPAGYNPWGRKESDMTKGLHSHTT